MNILQRHHLAYKLQSAILGVNWPVNAQEPDYVATLVSTLPGLIRNALTHYLPGRAIASGSAFIHQKPLAHFLNRPGMSDPELGDLLIVCREKRFSGVVYNSMLLQAKFTNAPLHTSIPNDHQYVLYSEWPEFEYKRAGVLNGKRRSILPKVITQGAQYLLIVGPEPLRLFTATVDRPLYSSKLFARTLAAILSFDAGRTFQASNPHDDWSQMVLDLLRLTASSVYTRRNSGCVKAKRWNGAAAFEYILSLGMQEEEKKEAQQVHGDYDAESISGISVVCVDLGEMQE